MNKNDFSKGFLNVFEKLQNNERLKKLILVLNTSIIFERIKNIKLNIRKNQSLEILLRLIKDLV